MGADEIDLTHQLQLLLFQIISLLTFLDTKSIFNQVREF